ncbi:hypothetical protein NUW58_g7847 [Xylaria curta]|uniref:Uncharacterized protein n=1 Tax=Xylaria curta TaxID=42375 RepID=A0ACC1NE43_9PEZI|nr:hypothetical protein NUW58_g7847 [Xylaria curta]
MSSKELLGDAIRTLTKKASRSLASKRRQSDTRQGCEGGHHRESLLHPDSMNSASPSVPRVNSTSTVSSNRDDASRSPQTPSADADDAELAQIVPRSSALQVTESRILNYATSGFPPVPEDAEFPLLAKPVLIPRVNPGGSTPFARAWAPELADYAVDKEDFVAFIDNLNIIITPHVAFRVLGFAGFAVGLVPYDIAEGVGGAVEVVAIVGAVAMNYKRTKNYIALMNEKYFHPRKLHFKIIGTKRLKKLFDLDKKDPCLAPLTETTLELTSQERCLQYLSQYTCELSFDVPPPSPATTTLAKISTWEVKHKVQKADKEAKASRKRSWKRQQAGKNPQTRWNSLGERSRVKSLDWLLIQNLEEWEAQKAQKEARKEEQKRASVWRNII